MFSWLRKAPLILPRVDMHSHLIPGIDDGVKTLEESAKVITKLSEYGFKKIITTPHIITNHYPNDRDSILGGLDEVKHYLSEKNISIQIEAAAEYFFDESFIEKVNRNESLLSFGSNKYVLVETGFMSKPIGLHEVFFEMISNGYTPVFAHPERYAYLYQDISFLTSLKEMGVKLQVNALSFIGHYSRDAMKFTEELVSREIVDFIGSDTHHSRHAAMYQKASQSKLFQKCMQLKLLNDAL